jgi:hypothetical protein
MKYKKGLSMIFNINSSQFKPILFVLLLLNCLLFSTTILASRVVETTGSANISAGAQHAAKELAIKNAMQQALLQNSAHIDSTSTISSNALVIDSARVNTSGTIENVKVLEEWIEDEIYFVRIRANIPDSNANEEPSTARYRKKIAAIQFDVLHRSEIYDVPNIERELPRELLRRLDNSGNFITYDATQYLVSTLHPGLRFDNPAVYKMIAEKTGAQIILSGQIRDLHVEDGFLQKKRQLEIEIYLHDGISGSRIARHRFSETVKNAGYFEDNPALFSNAGFYKTIFGNVIDQVLNSQIEFIQNDLKQIPFSAKIIRVAGQKVFFDAGTSSLINTGDMLMTFRLEADALTNANGEYFGYMETPVASLSVEQVQPQFAIGKVEIKNSKLSVGDLIRFGR